MLEKGFEKGQRNGYGSGDRGQVAVSCKTCNKTI